MPYDKKLMKSLQGKPCICCGSTYGTVAHHVKSVGSGGSNNPHNLMVLCFLSHRLVHDKGLWELSKNDNIYNWLSDNDWYIGEMENKWFHSLEN